MSATITPIQTNSARLHYIPELLAIHLEELEFLWGQRRLALHSPDYFLRDFLHLNERLEAHIQGLLAVPGALADLLLPQLQAAESRDSVFAAACPLLRLANPKLTEQVVEYFQQADATIIPGFRDAFSFAPAGLYVNPLKKILNEGEPLYAAYAATALANLRSLDAGNTTLNRLLSHENPLISTAAWHASLAVDALPTAIPPARPYQQALAIPDANIRDAVLKSAIWTNQPWITPALNQLVSAGDINALKWLAITGTSAHGTQIVDQLKLLESPQSQCEILVRFGHPGVLEILRDWVAHGDVLLASHAGDAFTRITGCDVQGERISTPISDDADEFEREFAPLIWTADLAKIDAYLRQNGSKLKSASRWSRGIPIDGEVSAETLATLDLQTRWDQIARKRLAGNRSDQPEPIVL